MIEVCAKFHLKESLFFPMWRVFPVHHTCLSTTHMLYIVCFCVCFTVVHTDTAPPVMWPAGCVWRNQLFPPGQNDIPEDPVFCQQSGGKLEFGQIHCLSLQWPAYLVKSSIANVLNNDLLTELVVLLRTSTDSKLYLLNMAFNILL